MLTADEAGDFAQMLWRANKETAAKLARESVERFPQPDIIAELDAQNGNQFGKLLADVQFRAFLLGAVATVHALISAEAETIATIVQ